MSKELPVKYAILSRITDALEGYRTQALARGLDIQALDEFENIIADIFIDEIGNKKESNVG